MDKVIDLKRDETFIPQYVDLRNRYSELLLTNPVTLNETKQWLMNENVEVRCLIEDRIVTGAAILYLNKDGEISFFVKDPNKGIGTKLLSIIEEVARERKSKSISAWVLKENLIAQRVFEKKGYEREGTIGKEYKGIMREGIRYSKYLVEKLD